MVKHIVLWKLKEELAAEEKEAVKQGIKEGLEGLAGMVPGLLEAKVQTRGLASSNVDVMLESLLENEEALKAYAAHPAHVKVAESRVRPYTMARTCMDYVVE